MACIKCIVEHLIPCLMCFYPQGSDSEHIIPCMMCFYPPAPHGASAQGSDREDRVEGQVVDSQGGGGGRKSRAHVFPRRPAQRVDLPRLHAPGASVHCSGRHSIIAGKGMGILMFYLQNKN